ncbi:transposase [Chryseobacterium phosphatilyticum]|uniref:Transposase n=1 Tax=Chryseobacterium phosphatilyticum TaxID=475075 RepID=A0A316X3Z8_9FLAO|nr:transposase [Chryseobacterium phosphatilyticum]PWN68304.1 transposase [Chryseobacterium phosphatilyticum]
MKVDLKSISIGYCIKERVKEKGISIERICKFLNSTELEVEKMYKQDSLDTESLLRWSKLLEYDFFRIYTQHLIMFAPQDGRQYNVASKRVNSSLPQFRKNIYTKELIYFILELIKTGKKTKLQIIKEYAIPKTTLYKWVEKYQVD